MKINNLTALKDYIEHYRAELAESIDEKHSINVPLILSLYNT